MRIVLSKFDGDVKGLKLDSISGERAALTASDQKQTFASGSHMTKSGRSISLLERVLKTGIGCVDAVHVGAVITP